METQLITYPKVEERVLFYNHAGATRRAEKNRALVDPDTGNLYAVVSDRYQLIPFERSVEMVEEAVTKLPEFGPYERSITFPKASRGPGKDSPGRMLARWRFTNDLVNIGGHEIAPEIILRRSYDTSWEFWLLAGAFRFVCMNGIVTGEKVLDFRHKHTSGIVMADLQKSLEGSMERFHVQANEWKQWNDRITTIDDYEHVMNVMNFSDGHLESIGNEVEVSSEITLDDIKTKTLSYYLFFQILSQYITHRVKSQMRQQYFFDRQRTAFYGRR
jgi:hypothetical protein